MISSSLQRKHLAGSTWMLFLSWLSLKRPAKLASTKSKLTELGAIALNIFQVYYAPLKRKSRSKKKNKHRAAKRKAIRTSQRTSAVLQKFAPGLDKDSLCEKGHVQKEIALSLKQREKKWSVSQSDTGLPRRLTRQGKLR